MRRRRRSGGGGLKCWRRVFEKVSCDSPTEGQRETSQTGSFTVVTSNLVVNRGFICFLWMCFFAYCFCLRSSWCVCVCVCIVVLALLSVCCGRAQPSDVIQCSKQSLKEALCCQPVARVSVLLMLTDIHTQGTGERMAPSKLPYCPLN